MPARQVPYAEGMNVGLGYDCLVGVALPSPSVTGSISNIVGADGQEVTSKILRIDDLESLHKEVGVSVDAGGSYWGIGGDAKVDFINSTSYNSFSIFLLVSVTVHDAFEGIASPALTDDAVELIKNNNKDRFRMRFGDAFISGLIKGGEYYAIYQISGTDQSQRESIAVKVQASFNDVVAAAHLDTDVKTETGTSSSHLTVQTFVFQRGAVDKTDQSMAEIMDKAHNFPPSVVGNLAYPYAVTLDDYTTLKLPNDQFNPLQIQQQADDLQDLARKRFDFIKLGNDIDYILQHPNDFDSVDASALGKMHDDVIDAINTMERQAEECAGDASKCSFTVFDVSKYSLPKLKTGGVAAYSSDPPATATSAADGVVLRKDLFGFNNYGQNDGAADIVHNGQQGTWHFVVPTDVDITQIHSAFVRVSMLSDDHGTGIDPKPISVTGNGDVMFAGQPGLTHGGPWGKRFTNWVQFDYPVTPAPNIVVSIANNAVPTARLDYPDWIGIDWIELHLKK